MRELTLTDRELQALIAPKLRRRLKKAGFVMGASEASDDRPSFYFVIHLDLVGFSELVRNDDGTWTISQCENAMVADRVASSNVLHEEAIARREAPQ